MVPAYAGCPGKDAINGLTVTHTEKKCPSEIAAGFLHATCPSCPSTNRAKASNATSDNHPLKPHPILTHQLTFDRWEVALLCRLRGITYELELEQTNKDS